MILQCPKARMQLNASSYKAFQCLCENHGEAGCVCFVVSNYFLADEFSPVVDQLLLLGWLRYWIYLDRAPKCVMGQYHAYDCVYSGVV